MVACRFLVMPCLGFQLFVTHLASAQQNFGVVQGRIAEGTQDISVTGRLLPQKVGTSLALVVPVSVNSSKTTWWIVDTGTPVSVIDPSFSKKLGLQADTNVGRFPVTMINGLQVGNFRCDGIACAVRSVADLRSISLRASAGSLEKTGLVGVNLLAKYGGLINCRTQQVFFSPTGNLGMSRQAYEQMGFTYVPMTVTPKNRLEVTGTLGGKEFSFFLDTGSFTTFHDFTKYARYSYGTATDFKLGNYDANGAHLGATTLNMPDPGSSHRFAGFLGMDFLFFRSAIIDVGGRALYLKPSSRTR